MKVNPPGQLLEDRPDRFGAVFIIDDPQIYCYTIHTIRHRFI